MKGGLCQGALTESKASYFGYKQFDEYITTTTSKYSCRNYVGFLFNCITEDKGRIPIHI